MDAEQNQGSPLFGLEIDSETRNSMNEMAKSARFMGIVAIALFSLFILFILIYGSALLSGIGFALADSGGAGGVLIFVLVIVIGIVALLLYFLLKASRCIKAGLQTNSQALLNEGLNALKTYFIIGGVIAILSTVSSLLTTF